MTPESFKHLFDVYGIAVVFGWGVLVKYHPNFKSLPNELIGWSGAAIYVATKLLAPGIANAAGFNVGAVAPDLVGVLLSGFTSATWARGLYEGFGRTLLTHWFGGGNQAPATSAGHE